MSEPLVYLLVCLAIIHFLVFLIGVGYAQNYYFHLRAYILPYNAWTCPTNCYSQATTRTMLTKEQPWTGWIVPYCRAVYINWNL